MCYYHSRCTSFQTQCGTFVAPLKKYFPAQSVKTIVLPVHPFSRRILLSEYGKAEPIGIRPNDILFSMLSVARVRDRNNAVRMRELLKAQVSFELDTAIATHIALRCDQVGLHLFKWHKDQLCRYVDLCLRRGGITAAGAIREFYELHDIGEDDFAFDSAWKMWQRHNAETGKENPVFSGRIRGATGVFFSKKRGRPRIVELPVSDEAVEALAARLADVLDGCLRNTPPRLLKHTRCYLYLYYARRNHRAVADRMRMPVSSVYYGANAIRTWRETDPTFRRLLNQVCDLP